MAFNLTRRRCVRIRIAENEGGRPINTHDEREKSRRRFNKPTGVSTRKGLSRVEDMSQMLGVEPRGSQ